MVTASPAVSPSVVAAIFTIQKIKVTSGTLLIALRIVAVTAFPLLSFAFGIRPRGQAFRVRLGCGTRIPGVTFFHVCRREPANARLPPATTADALDLNIRKQPSGVCTPG